MKTVSISFKVIASKKENAFSGGRNLVVAANAQAEYSTNSFNKLCDDVLWVVSTKLDPISLVNFAMSSKTLNLLVNYHYPLVPPQPPLVGRLVQLRKYVFFKFYRANI